MLSLVTEPPWRVSIETDLVDLCGRRNDGHNVTLHEFAHQLDQEDGAMDGAPLLGKRAMYAAWARVFGEEFAHLVEDVDKHRKTDIDA
jgi:Mlc titration factor MtfA (ptsG expression regulator)